MTELDSIILNKIEKVDDDIKEIKVTLTENTADLKHHIKRTNDLQTIVEDLHTIVDPLYKEYISKKAVEDYQKKQREDLVYKLKLPGYIVAAVAAIASALAWLMSK